MPSWYSRHMAYDLHTHSNCSDGSLPPEEVARRAARAALTGIALTDHDTTAGVERAAAVAGAELRVLTGCEFSAEVDGDSVHVLGIAFDADEPVFAEARQAIRDDRVRRAERTVERLRELGAPVTYEQVLEAAGGAAVGRPHIARAMVAAGVVGTVDEAFSLDWIGTGGRAYVPKQAVTPVEAVALIRGAGGAAVLAHPSLHHGAPAVAESLVRAMAAAGLAGIETEHPDQPEPERARWRALAAELGLATTGGSDDHGELTGYRLGACTTTEEALTALLATREVPTGT